MSQRRTTIVHSLQETERQEAERRARQEQADYARQLKAMEERVVRMNELEEKITKLEAQLQKRQQSEAEHRQQFVELTERLETEGGARTDGFDMETVVAELDKVLQQWDADMSTHEKELDELKTKKEKMEQSDA